MSRTLTGVAVTALVVGLAACGTSEPAATAPTTRDAEPVTVTDARGVEVTLDAPALRVGGTEWNVVEYAASLGVEPVAVADVDGFTTWDSAVELSGDVTDIGTRGEPSIDTIASLDLDVLLVTDELVGDSMAQIEEHTPVVVVPGGDASDPVGQMWENLDLVAELTGTQDRAEELRAEYDAAVAETEAAVEASDLGTDPVAFSDAYDAGGQVSIRPYGEGSLIGGVLAEVGITNAWSSVPDLETDPAYGLGQTDVEGLTRLPGGDALLVHRRRRGGRRLHLRAGGQLGVDLAAVRHRRRRAPRPGQHLDVRRTGVDGAVPRRRPDRRRLSEDVLTTTAPPRAGASDDEVVGAPAVAEAPRARAALGVTGLVVVLLGWIAATATLSIVQGTADLGAADVWRWATGAADDATAAVIVDSRLPRVAAALLIGIALGAAGAVMQSFSRNVLAAPDTLAVNEGAFLALTATAAFGLQTGVLGDLGHRLRGRPRRGAAHAAAGRDPLRRRPSRAGRHRPVARHGLDLDRAHHPVPAGGTRSVRLGRRVSRADRLRSPARHAAGGGRRPRRRRAAVPPARPAGAR